MVSYRDEAVALLVSLRDVESNELYTKYSFVELSRIRFASAQRLRHLIEDKGVAPVSIGTDAQTIFELRMRAAESLIWSLFPKLHTLEAHIERDVALYLLESLRTGVTTCEVLNRDEVQIVENLKRSLSDPQKA